MTVRPISGAISGEHVLVVAPKPAYPTVAANWQKRLRMFTGRALDATALVAEQQGRAAKLALLGQTRSPGIAGGLDVSLATVNGAQALVITPGLGLMASGETIVLGGPLTVPLAGVALDAPSQVTILVATPVTTEIAGNFDPEDPCDIDESEEAYADEQLVDGFELQFLKWDPTWGTLAANVTRNQFAYTVFEIERALAHGEIAPWQAIGVPLAALGIGASGVAWVDRHAVARRGGDAPYRTPLVHAVDRRPGTPPLWQARILQLSDQIADQVATGSLPTASAFLTQMPPGGVVPLSAVTVSAPPIFTNSFFPAPWKVKLAPLPLEQLDGVLQRVAQLAPLDLTSGEEVLVVVPVPQAVYDPDLLVVETVDPAFQTAIDTLSAQRLTDLETRGWLRITRNVLISAIDPTQIDTLAMPPIESDPSTDPGALEKEGMYTPAQHDEQLYGTKGGACEALTGFQLYVTNNTFLTSDNQDPTTIGLATYIAQMQALISKANDIVDFGFLQTQSDIYRLRQQMLGNDMATKLATSPALAQIAQGITATAVRGDLAALFTQLKAAPAADTSSPGGGAAATGAQIVARMAVEPVKKLTVIPQKSSAISELEKPSQTPAASRQISSGISPAAALVAGATKTAAPKTTPLTLTNTGVALRNSAESDLVLRSTNGDILHIANSGVSTIPAQSDITQASAIVGSAEFRNVTVAERLAPPPAADARNYTIQNRADTLNAMVELSTYTFPGTVVVTKKDANGNLPNPNPPAMPFGMLLDNIVVYAVPDDGTKPVAGMGRPRMQEMFPALAAAGSQTIATDAATNLVSEGDYFHDATVVLEAHISLLRQLEGVVYAYQQVLDAAQATLSSVSGNVTAINRRLQAVGADLTDKRSAVATAEALMTEETARVARVNTTRQSVLATQVPYLGYVRARFFEALATQPMVGLDPALLEAAVPACLAGHEDAPDEIAQMTGLLKEAPLAWLKQSVAVLPILNRIDLIQGLVVTAQARAQQQANVGFTMPFVASPLTGSFGPAISAVGRAQVDAIWQPRAAVASFDLRSLVGLSWTESRDTASLVASLGDVIANEHLQTAATVKAQQIITQIEEVATCIWSQVGQVAPVIRLGWAQALDEGSANSSLSTLTGLPGWLQVPALLRQSIDQLAEWLLTQIDTTIAPAVAFVHDLVRVCILLASHAPVDQILSGSIPVQTKATPGSLVPVKIDPSKIRIGMQVSFYAGKAAVAQGIVENLVGDQAQTRIAKATVPTLDTTATARFAFAGSAVLPLTRELG
ncbi:MAG TPA: hypothetical protein VGM88_15140 [Kofleriaceae bacterium]|jgi:hypothetical protein